MDCVNQSTRRSAMDEAVIPNLFLDPNLSDVQITINLQNGDKLKVPGHSLVLKTSSEVFKTMLGNGTFLEGQTGVVEIQVPGDKQLGFNFLRFLYTKKLQDTEADHYVALIRVAHMYAITDLSVLCEKPLLAKLTPYSVCRIYESVIEFTTQEFKDGCQAFMFAYAFLIFSRDLHLMLEEETMKILLMSDKLNTANEDDVLNALLRWGYTKSVLLGTSPETKRQYISNLLPLLKWQLVKNDAGNEEISNLISEFNVDTIGQPCYRHRMHTFSILDFAEVLHTNSERIVLGGFVMDRDYELTTVCALVDIWLVGLSIDMIFKEKISWKGNFELLVNNVNVKERVTSKELVIERRKISDEWHYTTHVELEFRNPIHLIRSSCSVIKQKGPLPVSFPEYRVFSRMFRLKHIRLEKNVLGVTELYYFVK